MENEDLEKRFNPMIAEALKEYTKKNPYSALLGLAIEDASPGGLVCTLPVRKELESGVGAVHGGAISSLIDHTLSLTVYPLVEVGKWVATLEMKINYLAAVREGTLRATGRLLSLRRNIAVVAVDVENEGKTVAVAQGTLWVRDK